MDPALSAIEVPAEPYIFTLDRVAEAQAHLSSHGYAVFSGIIPPRDCEELCEEYNQWFLQFGDVYPDNLNSIIQQYTVAHLEPTWRVRLMVKKVFAALWDTEKLLSSFDAIAVAEPPEMGRTKFADKHNLHLDQGKKREGLHSYQGAVYLEEQTKEDWCFQVLEESHKHFHEFFTFNSNFRGEFKRLTIAQVEWYLNKGCQHVRLPVPKGGVLVWDSRLVHAGAAPIEGREHKDRWRYVTFVSMGPAVWATKDVLAKKRSCFTKLQTTKHWPSDGVGAFINKKSPHDLKEAPEIMKDKDVLLLAGVEEYDWDDGKSNGPDWKPKWNESTKANGKAAKKRPATDSKAKNAKAAKRN